MGWIDIGANHKVRFKEYDSDPNAILSDQHLTPEGKLCQGSLTITGGAWHREFIGHPDGGIVSWELLSVDPITISPSVLCRVCGDHGFIQNGKWVKA